MNRADTVNARRERIAADTTRLIDYTSRVLGAIEGGNWHYAAQKLPGLRDAIGALEDDLAATQMADLSQITGPAVWDQVAPNARHYWLGRAIFTPHDDAKGRNT